MRDTRSTTSYLIVVGNIASSSCKPTQRSPPAGRSLVGSQPRLPSSHTWEGGPLSPRGQNPILGPRKVTPTFNNQHRFDIFTFLLQSEEQVTRTVHCTPLFSHLSNLLNDISSSFLNPSHIGDHKSDKRKLLTATIKEVLCRDAY